MEYEIEFRPKALKAKILTKNGKQFVVLTHEEFEAIQEELEQLDDLRALRMAKAEDGTAPGMSLTEVKRRYGIE